jgi:hypothetical protein
MAERKKIAAVLTWYIPGSHSDVLVGKFLPGRGIALDDGFYQGSAAFDPLIGLHWTDWSLLGPCSRRPP